MSIWFTKAFIGAVLCKNGRWMGTLSEECGDEGSVSVCEKSVSSFAARCVQSRRICLSTAVMPRLGPARKFAVDTVSNAPGSAACCCGSPARCILLPLGGL
jgi:hypothetical protein